MASESQELRSVAQDDQPSDEAIAKSIQACIDNGSRLIDETYFLEFEKPPSTKFFLANIAQEEFAKGFILFLVRKHIVRLSAAVLRATKDHTCKQLVGIIMDYIIMHWDELDELHALVKMDHDSGDLLPNDVGSAMDLLRHEKIRRWEKRNWVWAEDPQYDKKALKIAEGARDRHKQNALYVGIDSHGRVCSTPDSISEEDTRKEFDRACRFKRLMESLLRGELQSSRYEKTMATLTALFDENTR